ncbi:MULTISPECIES: hypothetical protein [Kamptonema]|nr:MULTISPECIES: hypothetical protein [Kamptonema]
MVNIVQFSAQESVSVGRFYRPGWYYILFINLEDGDRVIFELFF